MVNVYQVCLSFVFTAKIDVLGGVAAWIKLPDFTLHVKNGMKLLDLKFTVMIFTL